MFKFLFKPKIITMKQFTAKFVTTDSFEHETGKQWNFIAEDYLYSSGPDYLMIGIKSRGYIKDEKGLMYPLTNVLSIEWSVVEEAIIFDKLKEFEVFATKEEVNKFLVTT